MHGLPGTTRADDRFDRKVAPRYIGGEFYALVFYLPRRPRFPGSLASLANENWLAGVGAAGIPTRAGAAC